MCTWLGSLTRRVLAIPATSAAPERVFSLSGNTMTKKRTRQTCDHLEEPSRVPVRRKPGL